VLSEPWKREKRRRRGVDGEVRAAVAAGPAEEIDAGVAGSSGWRKRSGRVLRGCKGNQQDRNGTGGDELERRSGSPAAASSRIPVDTEA
jgi:hypothetical protein